MSYSGAISQTIYNNQTVSSGKHSISLNFLNSPIIWSGSVPSDLTGITLSQLLANTNYLVTYSYNIKIKGEQEYEDWSQAETSVTIYTPSGNINKTFKASGPSINGYGTASYNVNSTFSGSSYPTKIDIDIKNNCSGLPCDNHSANKYTFTLTLNVKAVPNNSTYQQSHVVVPNNSTYQHVPPSNSTYQQSQVIFHHVSY